jgi:hypothetical protein
MQVALNGDDGYRGGRLVFATTGGFVVPMRPAGSATIHTHAVPHGVSTLLEGVRYGLFLCDTKERGDMGPTSSSSTELRTTTQLCDHLQYLVDAAIQSVELYAKIICFINATPDDELYRHQREYAEVFDEHNRTRISSLSTGVSPSSSRPEFHTFAGEVFWHLHTLYPRSFNSAVPVSVNGLDLVVAGKLGLSFMQQIVEIVEAKTAEGSPHGLESLFESALLDYVEFLLSLGKKYLQGCAEVCTPVPSLLVDHIWHTHMSLPQKYTADCLRLCGRLVDHVVAE